MTNSQNDDLKPIQELARMYSYSKKTKGKLAKMLRVKAPSTVGRLAGPKK